ncbi:TPA: hypothetical protein EYP38_00655 [Candidatus Micrarchaeota archaeon]|nr:hypothetical protein [Candidatus Micrarchaeota archaeon]
MRIARLVFLSVLASGISPIALADAVEEVKTPAEATHSSSTAMPMMQGQRGHIPMMGNPQGGGMPMMKMMQERQAMMQAHMKKMETHLANIEALLKQLVELNRK